MIAGGLYIESAGGPIRASQSKQYSCVNTVYKLDLNTLRWTKLAKLNFKRTLYSSMAIKENGQVFAVGGT